MTPHGTPIAVTLRGIEDDDLPVLFAHSHDPESVRMAAFTADDPTDRAAFDAHWDRIRADPDVLLYAVTATGSTGTTGSTGSTGTTSSTGTTGGHGSGPVPGELLGHAAVYGPPDEREVTYWIGRAHWGRGVATGALRALLATVPERPLLARVAEDNEGSLRVLRACGFTVTGRGRDYAAGRGEETGELVLTLV
ncbi:GNAT family N-acetyltransferase [Streptomyces sp. JNUCC 64]